MHVILGSSSPQRLSVLRTAGIQPTVIVSNVDEDALVATLTNPTPAETVSRLAEAKAQTVAEMISGTHSDAVIIGCDSMVAIGGELLGKPADADAARKQWSLLAGNTAEVFTGHAVIRVENGQETMRAQAVDVPKVHFSSPTPAELDAFIATGEPLRTSGSFTVERLGGWFIDGIDGHHSSVIGISLPLTKKLFAEVGVNITDLWQPGDWSL